MSNVKVAGAVIAALALTLGLATPAQASTPPVTVKAHPAVVVHVGHRTSIKPTITHRTGIQVSTVSTVVSKDGHVVNRTGVLNGTERWRTTTTKSVTKETECGWSMSDTQPVDNTTIFYWCEGDAGPEGGWVVQMSDGTWAPEYDSSVYAHPCPWLVGGFIAPYLPHGLCQVATTTTPVYGPWHRYGSGTYKVSTTYKWRTVKRVAATWGTCWTSYYYGLIVDVYPCLITPAHTVYGAWHTTSARTYVPVTVRS